MSHFKAAFFDVDDTLYDHFKHEYPADGIEAIREMARRGIKVFLCSARPYGSQKDFKCFDLGIEWSGFIASSGGVAVVGDKVVHKEYMKKRDVYALVKKAKSLGLTAELVTTYDRYMIAPPNEYSERYHAIYKDETNVVRDYRGENSSGLLLFAPKEYDEEMLSAAPGAIGFRFEEYGIEFMGSMHSKGKAIEDVLNYLGIDKEDAISFGDNLQDIPMADATGCFVCMGNGRDEVKAAADYVTDSVSDNGLANAIHKLILGD
ncbi:MAG: HAD family hydrolase [Bacilli bacterium]|nr:HAD family hydrolase [Bacilli bacterium]